MPNVDKCKFEMMIGACAMLTLYFSGTGNTKYIADLFSQKMNTACISIEADIDFVTEIKTHDIIAFCYPIYCSRVPRIMREFVYKHMADLQGKKIITFVTQMKFSGDGARVFTDMFEDDAIEVIYAEHFNMQQNMGNTPVLNWWAPNEKSKQKHAKKAEAKMNIVCGDIKNNIIKKRGFSKGSEILGYIQGKPWQKDTKAIAPQRLEKKVARNVKIHQGCTSCNICTKICPMDNLVNREGQIYSLDNCTICYRCVNCCPQKAITVFIHTKPRWQYIHPKYDVMP